MKQVAQVGGGAAEGRVGGALLLLKGVAGSATKTRPNGAVAAVEEAVEEAVEIAEETDRKRHLLDNPTLPRLPLHTPCLRRRRFWTCSACAN